MSHKHKTSATSASRVGLMFFFFLGALFFAVSIYCFIAEGIGNIGKILFLGLTPPAVMFFSFWGWICHIYEWDDETISRRGLFGWTTLAWDAIESVRTDPKSSMKIWLAGGGTKIKINFESVEDNGLRDAIFSKTRRLFSVPFETNLDGHHITVDERGISCTGDDDNWRIDYIDARYVLKYPIQNNFKTLAEWLMILDKDQMAHVLGSSIDGYGYIERFIKEKTPHALFVDPAADSAPQDKRAAFLYHFWNLTLARAEIKSTIETAVKVVIPGLFLWVAGYAAFKWHQPNWHDLIGEALGYAFGPLLLGIIYVLAQAHAVTKARRAVEPLERELGTEAEKLKTVLAPPEKS